MDPTEILPLEVIHNIFMLLSPCKEIPTASMVSNKWRFILKEVCRLRINYLLSAFCLRSDLRWFPATLPFKTNELVHKIIPSERFGSTLILKNEKLYVFGGATSELTAFNDLWVFELQSSSWSRLTKKGEPPSPRAFAKGGFIDNTLYIYGGCQNYPRSLGPWVRIDWLKDMYSFCIETETWSCVKLRSCCGQDSLESSSTLISYSGTFLPAASDFPASFILFGGYSRQDGVCVNTTQVVIPVFGTSFPLPVSYESASRPSGRYGHTTCALGNNRIIILGGNLNPPQGIDPGLSSLPASNQSPNPYIEGNPAKDIWLLTRSRRKDMNQEICQLPWFWSKVVCAAEGPCCPPMDFYHAVAVCLPIFVDPHHEDDKISDHPWSVDVVLISAASQHIRNMTASMRRRKRLLGHHCSSNSSAYLSTTNEAVIAPEPPGQQPMKGTIFRQQTSTFKAPMKSRSNMETGTSFSAKPLVSYSLKLSARESEESTKREEFVMVEGEWKGLPSRSELQSAPHERLGYSCVQGFGSIFLFGGIQPHPPSTAPGIPPVYHRPGGITGSTESNTGSSNGSEGDDNTSEEDEVVTVRLKDETETYPLHIQPPRQSILLYCLHSADFVSNLT